MPPSSECLTVLPIHSASLDFATSRTTCTPILKHSGLANQKKQMPTIFHIVIKCPKMDESRSVAKNSVLFSTFDGKSG